MDRARQLPPLKALLAFDAGARLGSFTKAAKELHVTQTAISHQIRLLENYYEQKLFDRTSRDLVLTESGTRLRAVTTELFDRLDQVSQDLKPGVESEQGPLRITLPPSLGSFWLAPRLGQFWAEHSIDLHLIPAREILDFQLHKIDLGIRCGTGDWPGMEAEFLMPMNIVPVCSPELLAQRPCLDKSKDLANYTLLHEINYDQWGEWLAARGLDHIDSSRGVVCQDTHMLYNLALNGQGIALVTLQVVSEELKTGRLVRLFPELDESTSGYYLVHRKDVRLSPRAQIYREFVLQQARLPV